MTGFILSLLLITTINRVNTDYCLLQNHRIQANISDMIKQSLEQTWDMLQRTGNWAYFALIPSAIEAAIVLRYMLGMYRG